MNYKQIYEGGNNSEETLVILKGLRAFLNDSSFLGLNQGEEEIPEGKFEWQNSRVNEIESEPKFEEEFQFVSPYISYHQR